MVEEMKERILELVRKTPEGLDTSKLLEEIGSKNSKAFYDALTQLTQSGKVSVSRTHRVRMQEDTATVNAQASKAQEEPEGSKRATIISLSRGFAFARPEDGGKDMFIHGSVLKSAFLGDTVLVTNIQETERGMSAEVYEVLEQRERILTGTIVRTGPYLEMRPDEAIRYNIPLSRRTEITPNEGDKVQAKMEYIPHTDRLIANIIKVYGIANNARICSDALIDQHQIRTHFPQEVIAEARKIAQSKITEEDLKDRLDLRDACICTIDSESAKDLDDAISVVRTDSGFRLGVHIADVSHYVREGTALDAEAQLRGTSVYFADRVIPMLPEEISNGVCSLNAGQEKLTFSALIDLDKKGSILSYEFHKSVLISKVRGVYSEVNKIFEGSADDALLKKYAPVQDSLDAALELSDILKERSKANGTMELESNEPHFVLDENGVCIDIEPRHSGRSEQMIEQLMITANQAAAKLAKEMKLPFVYRVHELPSPDRVDTLADLVGALGLNAKSLKHTGDITAADFAEIMKQAVDTPAQKVVSHQLLRTMAKARYDTTPVGHFGLALADYCHFTSPIRRYPDTAIHRILGAYLRKDKDIAGHYTEYVHHAAVNSSKSEIRAMLAERGAEDCYMAEYMTQHIAETYTAVISGVSMRGVFVQLPNTVEGFVPAESFENANFSFDGMISQVDANTGRKLTIGQELVVKCVAADVASGRIDFVPVE